MAGKTLYDKLWDQHLVSQRDDGTALIYIDRQLIHGVTAPPAVEGLTEAEYQKVVSKPVVQSCDMVPAEQANEAVEVISMAVDKHVSTGNYEAMCKIVKETMDRKYGPQWHCAIGEGFGFDVTYQQPNMIYVYYGKIGILLFKC